MKFTLECDEMDGLVFIDESYLSELNDGLLYAMDILLDSSGTSELVYDFPNEDWDAVRQRETKQLREFCGQGKMIIWLLDSVFTDCEIEKSGEIAEPCKWLHLPTGKLSAFTAGELIQCLPYPELEPERVFELSVEAGWYAVQNEEINKIMYCRKNCNKKPFDPILLNIREIF